MPRIFIGLAFFPLYLGWLAYRAFIKKDIKQHKNDLYGLTFFVAVWVLIYTCFFL